MDESLYMYEETNYAEQYNTLLVLDTNFMNFKHSIPEFHILGGTALLFHGVNFESTIDIDTANLLDDRVKEIVDPLISDNSAEVATLAKNYVSRLVPFKPEVFKHIKVFILSIEDLAITKLGAWRVKDQDDLRHSKLLLKCDHDKLYDIMHKELPKEIYGLLLRRLASIER